MKVLQVATWVAPGNPFGGPVTVAENLARALEEDGHQVELIAAGPKGSDGKSSVDAHTTWRVMRGWRIIPGVRFSGIISPSLFFWVLRNARSYDVIHVHAARDLVTLPAALAALARGSRLVVQTHGMIANDRRISARLLDRLLTRPVLQRARGLFALTNYEQRELSGLLRLPASRVAILPNGVPPIALEPTQSSNRPEFLFCSRLHPRKRPKRFAAAAIQLIEEGTEASFRMVGADGGERRAVADQVRQHLGRSILLDGAVSHQNALRLIANCDVLVLPSVDEPYPMVVLEAMSLGKPVVITRSCGLAEFVETFHAGIVVTPDSTEELAVAMTRLAIDPHERRNLGLNAADAVRTHRSIRAVASELAGHYRSATG